MWDRRFTLVLSVEEPAKLSETSNKTGTPAVQLEAGADRVWPNRAVMQDLAVVHTEEQTAAHQSALEA